MMKSLIFIPLSVFSLVANVIGLTIPWWMHGTIHGVQYFSGLWEKCSTLEGSVSCTPSDLDNALDVMTPVLELLGTVLLCAAIICRSLMPLFDLTKFMPIDCTGPGLLNLIAGTFMILGSILYAARVVQPEGSDLHFHAGFCLCIVAGVLAIITGILDSLIKRQRDYTEI